MNEMVVIYLLSMIIMVIVGAVAFVVCIKTFIKTQKEIYNRGWGDGSPIQVQEPEGLEPDSQGDESGFGKAAFDRDGSADAAREAEKERDLSLRLSKPAKPVVRFGEEDD